MVRVPKNMGNPINEVKIISLPEDYAIYKEVKDPQSGKLQWKVD